MIKSLLKRISRSAADEVDDVAATKVNANSDYVSLVDRIIKNDPEAEDELVRIFKHRLTPIILRITRNASLAEDISQDTFLKTIERIRNGELDHPESLGAFVASVARYHAIGRMRTLRRRETADLELAQNVSDPAPSPLEELQTSEQYKEIRELLNKLNSRYRELLLRHYVNEESKEQICADLGLTSAQFDNVIYRARESFKSLCLKRSKQKKER